MSTVSWKTILTTRPRDPGHIALRSAGRAVIVAPLVFFVLETILDDSVASLFGAFASFALLVFADFGGLMRRRASAYVVATAIGAAMVALGTLCSVSPWLAGVVMVVVGFAALFSGVLGGYFVPGATPVILSFVLAATLAGGWDDVGGRLVGWIVGGLGAAFAGTFLWPRHEHDTTRKLAAAAAQDLATAVIDGGAVPAAREAIDTLRAVAGATPYRSVGPRERDRALLQVVESLAQCLELLEHAPRPHPKLVDDGMVDALTFAAQTLRGEPVDQDGAHARLRRVLAERIEQREAALDHAAAQLAAGESNAVVLKELDTTALLRLSMVSALATAAFASLSVGEPIPEEVEAEIPGEFTATGPRATLPRAWRVLRTQCTPSSLRFRNALRGALGLGIAVVVAITADLDHGFWVVLGTLSVLRSNAVGTGRTYIEALIGTMAGFVVASAVIGLTGDNSTVLWILLPIVVFIAAYTPNAVSFIVGQGAFTVFVVVLFNIIDPAGWSTGLVRFVDIAIGGAVSVVVGVFFWPRGARGEMGNALADMYRRCSAYLAASIKALLDGTDIDSSPQRLAAIKSERRGATAFDQYLVERRGDPLTPTIVKVLSTASYARAAADQMRLARSHGFNAAAFPGAAQHLAPSADAVVGEYLRIAEEIATGEPFHVPSIAETDGTTEAAVLEAIDAWRADLDNHANRQAVIAMVIAREWTERLRSRAGSVDDAAVATGRSALLPWWS